MSFAAAVPFLGMWSDAHRREIGKLAAEWKKKPLPNGETASAKISSDGSSGRRRVTTNEPRYSGVAADYASFIGGLGLRHIRPHELISAHDRARRGVHNTLPPRELWERMGQTLLVADELRDRLGVPLRRITSAYRSPAYNARCPGAARNSQHTQNRALDLIFDASPGRVFKTAERLRAEGAFRGGIGLYPGFVHVDTRGHNATW